MTITTGEQARQAVNQALILLDALSVRGYTNCAAIFSISKHLQALEQYLKEAGA